MEIRINKTEKNKEYIKICKSFRNLIVIGFIIKSIFFMIGNECFTTNKKFPLDIGNEAFINLGNEAFVVFCILAVVFALVKSIILVKDDFFRSIRTDDTDFIEISRKQANFYFAISITACILGFLLIVISVIWISAKDDSVISFLLVLSGIVSEIIALGFLIVYNKTIQQLIIFHKLTIKKEHYLLLLRATDKLQNNKDQAVNRIIDNILKDYEKDYKEEEKIFKKQTDQ